MSANPWARNPWFETVTEAQRRAKKRLPKSLYSSLVAGTQAGVTVYDNVRAFSELGWAPHVVGAQSDREMTTTVMGEEISFPVMISPTGVQAVDPDGEVAVARAAAARGTAMGLSSFASHAVEEVTAVNDKTFFQLNVSNLFNEFYVGYISGSSNNTSVPFVQFGAPRAVSGSIVIGF